MNQLFLTLLAAVFLHMACGKNQNFRHRQQLIEGDEVKKGTRLSHDDYLDGAPVNAFPALHQQYRSRLPGSNSNSHNDVRQTRTPNGIYAPGAKRNRKDGKRGMKKKRHRQKFWTNGVDTMDGLLPKNRRIKLTGKNIAEKESDSDEEISDILLRFMGDSDKKSSSQRKFRNKNVPVRNHFQDTNFDESEMTLTKTGHDLGRSQQEANEDVAIFPFTDTEPIKSDDEEGQFKRMDSLIMDKMGAWIHACTPPPKDDLIKDKGHKQDPLKCVAWTEKILKNYSVPCITLMYFSKLFPC